MPHLLPWIFSALSGVLLGLCYPPADLGNLVWIALAPLAWAVWFSPPAARRAWLRLAGLGYLCGLVFFAMSAFWLTTLTWPGYLLLVLYFAAYFAAWTLFAGLLVSKNTDASEPSPWLRSFHNLRVCVLGAAGWTALEWLRGIIFPAFGWNGLGIAQHANIPLIQIADITGVGGISFLIAMANLMLAATLKRLWLEIGRGARRPHYDFALTIALVALAWTYGIRQLFDKEPDSTELSFAAVQAAIPQQVRNSPDFELEVLETYKNQTLAAIAMQPDLILWPESSTPSPLLGNQFTWDLVRGLAEQHSGDLLLGTVHWGKEGDYNSIALLTNRGTEAQLHHKIHLVPFGEYVPLRQEFPLLARIVGDLVPSDFDPGKNFTVLELQSQPVKLGPLVCFEDTLGDLARRFAQLGAQAFVVVTNDGWFLESSGSLQHLRNALVRCVETGLPMIRAANTGITCAIDRNGVVREILRDTDGSTFQPGILFSKISAPKNPAPTFYTLYGEVFSIACFAISALAAALTTFRLVQKPSPRPNPVDPPNSTP
ncbi:MAG: apolipoprotein N-acyltransferase [Verrucomicrobiota bacterium]